MKEIITPQDYPVSANAFSPAVSYDMGDHRIIFLSGQLAIDRNGKVVAPDDVQGQSEFIFENFIALLSACGASLDDIVKMQVFLTRIADYPKFNLVRNRYLATSRPASTLVETSNLVRPECCVEIEATAMRKRHKSE